MKFAAKSLFLALLCSMAIAQSTPPTFPTQLKNVVVIVQENRTPDNLFHFLSPLCPIPSGATGLNACIPSPVTSSCYDISPCGLSNQNGNPPVPVTLTGQDINGTSDADHSHTGFVNMCDLGSDGICRMDGAWQTSSISYAFVNNPVVTNYDRSTGHLLDPYIKFAENYGWANYMYQTNQGPSYPAHQFLFSGTSALSGTDDGNATFISENFGPKGPPSPESGCLTIANAFGRQLKPTPPLSAGGTGTCVQSSTCDCFYNNTVSECKLTNVLNGAVGTFCVPPAPTGHKSMADLLDGAGLSWKYYAPSDGSIWTAPNAIEAICGPAFDASGDLFCNGTEWKNHVDVANLGTDILTDIQNCKLSNVSWAIPNGTWSDHAHVTSNLGPSWVAAIINAIGNSTCKDSSGNTYWQDTAIIVTWDDWGGWSDNQPAKFLQPQVPCTVANSLNCPGDYQYGFRVPLLVVSAYTPAGYINNGAHDFGSILKMIEHLNGLGNLGFADFRANGDLVEFFQGAQRGYTTVVAIQPASYFINQGISGTPVTDPDDD
jgi:phospholipase C